MSFNSFSIVKSWLFPSDLVVIRDRLSDTLFPILNSFPTLSILSFDSFDSFFPTLWFFLSNSLVLFNNRLLKICQSLPSLAGGCFLFLLPCLFFLVPFHYSNSSFSTLSLSSSLFSCSISLYGCPSKKVRVLFLQSHSQLSLLPHKLAADKKWGWGSKIDGCISLSLSLSLTLFSVTLSLSLSLWTKVKSWKKYSKKEAKPFSMQLMFSGGSNSMNVFESRKGKILVRGNWKQWKRKKLSLKMSKRRVLCDREREGAREREQEREREWDDPCEEGFLSPCHSERHHFYKKYTF